MKDGMNTIRNASILALLTVAGVTSVASAQNYGAQPLYGTVTLSAGFMPDPNITQVQAGGSDSVSGLNLAAPAGDSCRGHINAAAPDVRLNFSGSGGFLRVGVRAQSDTTLVINMPDGSWRCADDTFGLNPALDFQNAPSGQYDIWVGTYSSGSPVPAEVLVTEFTSDSAFTGNAGGTPNPGSAGGGGRLDHSQTPRTAPITLAPGFMPDPHTVNITAGGSLAVSGSNLTPANGGPCRGSVAGSAPDFRVNLSGNSNFLRFFVRSTADSTLIINAPNGQWHCQDDSVGTNPVIDFNNAPAGQYDIWVGMFSATTAQPATLGITELSSVQP